MEKYKAVTLLELIIVMIIIFILSTISVLSYRSLVDSFSINEVSLTIAQDIRATQRAAMMLDRESDERWLHGIGLDFRNLGTDERSYNVFKWCSPYDYFDNSKESLTGEVPNYNSSEPVLSELKISNIQEFEHADHCNRGVNQEAFLVHKEKRFGDYNNLDFNFHSDVRFILFESVSGKAFFYGDDNLLGVARLLNYHRDGGLGGTIHLNSAADLQHFALEIEPMRRTGLASRTLNVRPVSGMINFEIPE